MKFPILYLIDDDATYQFITSRTINSTGLVEQVKIFTNGDQAMRMLQSNIEHTELWPDIILLDLMMPVLDGWGFLEEYRLIKRKIHKTTIIYVVSSSINPVDVERAKNISEVTDYIVKPTTVDKFKELICSLN